MVSCTSCANTFFLILKILGILVLAFIVFALLFWRLWFCRKPARTIPKGEKLIVAPANGTVAIAEPFGEKTKKIVAEKWNHGRAEILTQDVAKEGFFVLIVMTPMNVHYQRMPVDAEIVATKHVPGKFLNAVKDPATFSTIENERNEVLLRSRHGKLKVVQIAGFLARRISCYVKPKQKINKGEVIGFINLGSQVAMVLPSNVKLRVRPGDVTIDGETIIGEFA